MFKKLLALSLVLSASAAAQAQASLDLSRYRITQEFMLPWQTASESSAITYNWDTGTLFVVGDEGRSIVEVSRTGTALSTMSLSGFEDTEGLTYVGGGQFVIAEEREQDLYRLSYSAGGSVSRNGLSSFSLGSYNNNEGIEGVSYDPLTGKFYAVKEKNPQAVYEATIDFSTGTGSHASLFTPNLGVSDLSDIQVLSTTLAGNAFDQNLLVYSQESRSLLEVTRSGQVLSRFDLSRYTATAEGVTIDAHGVIYITDESPSVFVLTPLGPVPEASTTAMMLAGLGFMGAVVRRRRRA